MNSKSAEHYLDHNASTLVRPESLEAFVEYSKTLGANPSALHRPGRRAQGVLESARDKMAELLGCRAKQVVFTASATEANNLAILGAVKGLGRLNGEKPQLITSLSEHPAVTGPMRALQRQGYDLRLLGLDRHGRASAAEAHELLERRPSVIAIQWANNETGAIQKIESIAAMQGHSSHFHCDAVQGFGKLELNSTLQNCSSYSLSGHKLGAPIGVGALILGDDAILDACFFGGGHQNGIRPGTESPALAAALTVALELALSEQKTCAKEMQKARKLFLDEIKLAIPDVVCNHPKTDCLPNTLSLSFPGIDGRLLLPALDAEGIAASSGSACSSGAPQASAILRACGISSDLARATLRFSFGRDSSLQLAKVQAQLCAQIISRVYILANT